MLIFVKIIVEQLPGLTNLILHSYNVLSLYYNHALYKWHYIMCIVSLKLYFLLNIPDHYLCNDFVIETMVMKP